jgi:hypothetical protein
VLHAGEFNKHVLNWSREHPVTGTIFGQTQPTLQQVLGSNVGEAIAAPAETIPTEALHVVTGVVRLHCARRVSLAHEAIRGRHVGQHVVLSRVGITPLAQVTMLAGGNAQSHRTPVGLQE